MSQSECYLFKRSWEFIHKDDLKERIPTHVRGLYVLYHEGDNKAMNVVYIGMARGDKSGALGRLLRHKNNKRKKDLWTHCSVFEVWDNITKQQVEELEGLFRHIFRRDLQAQSLNTQRVYNPLRRLTLSTKHESTKQG